MLKRIFKFVCTLKVDLIKRVNRINSKIAESSVDFTPKCCIKPIKRKHKQLLDIFRQSIINSVDLKLFQDVLYPSPPHQR